MADILDFPDKAEPLIWVCGCGCTSFSLFSNDSAECLNCGKSASSGAWRPKDIEIVTPDAKPHSVVVIKENSPMFALRSALDSAAEVAFAVIQYVSGRQVTWSMIEPDNEHAINWARLKLDDAKRSVLKEGPPKCH